MENASDEILKLKADASYKTKIAIISILIGEIPCDDEDNIPITVSHSLN